MNTVLANSQPLASDVNQIINALMGALSDTTLKTPPIGAIAHYCGATAPAGWLLCNGSAVSRTTYANLFAAIGTTYGAGDGSTTFNLPEGKGRSIVGAMPTPAGGHGFTARSYGNLGGTAGGCEVSGIDQNYIPSHTHTQGDVIATNSGGNIKAFGSNDRALASGGLNNSTDSGNQSGTPLGGSLVNHNNLSPLLVLTTIIKI